MRDSACFITSFKLHVIGFFLPQLASKLLAAESGSPEKVLSKAAFYYIDHHRS